MKDEEHKWERLEKRINFWYHLGVSMRVTPILEMNWESGIKAASSIQGQGSLALNFIDDFTCSMCMSHIWYRDFKLFPHREFLKHEKVPENLIFFNFIMLWPRSSQYFFTVYFLQGTNQQVCMKHSILVYVESWAALTQYFMLSPSGTESINLLLKLFLGRGSACTFIHIWPNSKKTQLIIQMLCQHWAKKKKWQPRNIQVMRFLFWLSAHQPENQLSNGGN